MSNNVRISVQLWDRSEEVRIVMHREVSPSRLLAEVKKITHKLAEAAGFEMEDRAATAAASTAPFRLRSPRRRNSRGRK